MSKNGSFASGFDTIDTAAARSLGIDVMNTPGANANAVAELVFGMVVTASRNFWDGTSGWELRGKVLALYGFGAVTGGEPRGAYLGAHARDKHFGCQPRAVLQRQVDVARIDDAHAPERAECRRTDAPALRGIERLVSGAAASA